MLFDSATDGTGSEHPNFQLPEGAIASIVNASPVGMMLVNANDQVVFANCKITDIFGRTNCELVGISIEALIPTRFRGHHARLTASYYKNPKPRTLDAARNVVGLGKDGQEISVEIGLSPIVIKDDNYVLVSILDISDRKRAEELEKSNQILKLAATHDSLTGLPNRKLFRELSENLRHLAVRNAGRLTVMYVDLDGFKNVNDKYGHDAGDMVLCDVATALRKHVRKSDVVGRIGGDEFLLCFSELHDSTEVEKISDNLLKAISAIRNINGPQLRISASIGAVSAVMSDHIMLDEIIKMSDRLMYKAKRAGNGKAMIYEYRISPR